MKRLILDATNRSLEAVLGGAITTSQPEFVASFVDKSTGSLSETATVGALNSTTPVTLVAAPSSGHKHTVLAINIYNKDTAAVTLTINYNDNSTLRVIWKGVLQAGERVTVDGVFDSSGALKTAASSIAASLLTGTVALANGGTAADNSSQTANKVFASPTSGGAGNMSIRALVDADLPTTLAGKTLTTPTIASFANAGHNHQDAAGGGTLDAAAVTSGTFGAARLPAMVGDSGSGGTKGAVPAPSTGDANKILFGDATWKYPAEKVIYARTALGSDTTSISITSIPATWNHLKLIVEPRSDYGTGTIDSIQIGFNTDSSVGNYYSQYAYFNGITLTAGQILGASYMILIPNCAPCNTAPAGNGAVEITIYNYSSSSLRRLMTYQGGAQGGTGSGANYTMSGWGVWTNTASAISSIQIKPVLGTNLKTGAAYTLLGVAA